MDYNHRFGSRGGGRGGRGGKGGLVRLREDDDEDHLGGEDISENKRKMSVCPPCGKEVRNGMKGVKCDKCEEWHHDKCIDIIGAEYKLIKKRNITWMCNECLHTRASPVKATGSLEKHLATIADSLTKVLDRLDNIEGRAAGPTEEVVDEMVTSRVDEAMEEAMRKLKNEKNLIVVNIPESEKETPKEREKDDKHKMEILLRKILPDAEKEDLKISEQFRLGEKNKSKRPRMIKVQMDKTATKSKILKGYYKAINYREGKEVPQSDRIYFNRDQTKKERETDIKMKGELLRRRAEGEKDLVIRGGRIITDEGRDDMVRQRGNRGQFLDRNAPDKRNEKGEGAGYDRPHIDRGTSDPNTEKSQGDRDNKEKQENRGSRDH